MTANQALYPIQLMSKVPGVSRSGFYGHLDRKLCARDVADKELMKRIVQIHATSKQKYGAPRIHAELADEGSHVGRKRVERLMKAEGLKGVTHLMFGARSKRDCYNCSYCVSHAFTQAAEI